MSQKINIGTINLTYGEVQAIVKYKLEKKMSWNKTSKLTDIPINTCRRVVKEWQELNKSKQNKK